LAVLINEVAWAGTNASANDEWIELYNPGWQAINLSGWRLAAADGNPDISLSGQIAAGGYYLLERTDDTTISDIPADLIYSGSLINNGEILRLYAPDGEVVDTANLDGGAWPAGSGSPQYGSMERRGVVADSSTAWITNTGEVANGHDAAGDPIRGTPRQPNWAYTATPTSTFTLTPIFTPTSTATLTPTPVPALAVLINEVAWAGTNASANDEWIELYNPGWQAINLSGWRLAAADGNLDIALSGQIAAGGYYLLERTDDTTISDIPADLIYSGALSNNDEILRLYAPDGEVVDTANLDGGAWPAGSGSPQYGSMERRGVVADSSTAWTTNTGEVANGHDAAGDLIRGTPRQPNWAYTVTGTPTATATPTPIRTPTRTPIHTPIRTPTLGPGILVINEFLPRPRTDWNGDGAVNFEDEFIEVMNIGDQAADLRGLRLDDGDGGSSPYTLPSSMLQAGQMVVFYGSQTRISLSDGGDTVRLMRTNGEVVDIYNYPAVKEPDQSWCRLPDGRGAWTSACRPTPGNANAAGGTENTSMMLPPGYEDENETRTCLLPDTLPSGILRAECESQGAEMWNSGYWDAETRGMIWLESCTKWGVFIK
jgi:hypothetical protein